MALVQIAAYGKGDIYLTYEPQITFFKIVYRRHTNFSIETIRQPFNDKNPTFGKRISCTISKSGDLVGKMYVAIVLPSIPKFSDGITKFAWVRKIGYSIINRIEIEIGDQLIDSQYGEWMNIWYELNHKNSKNNKKLIGDVDELTTFTNGKQSYTLYVPLTFWFNRYIGLALPLISLKLNKVKINLELSRLDKCYIISPTHYIDVDNDFVLYKENEYIYQTINGITSVGRFAYFDYVNRRLYLWRISNNGFQSVLNSTANLLSEKQQQDILYQKNANGIEINEQYYIYGYDTNFKVMPKINASERVYTSSFNASSITLKDVYLLVDFIYLDMDEKIRFTQNPQTYLIEQLQYNGEKTIDGLNQPFNLGFSQLSKELFWVSQLSIFQNTRVNDLYNYTNSLLPNGSNIIVEETILLNGKERLSIRTSDYFNQIQPYERHYNSIDEGINIYSFSLHPNKHQPSCVINFNKFDSIQLNLKMSSGINFENTATLRVYSLTNNILKIVNGISSLIFSNDNSTI